MLADLTTARDLLARSRRVMVLTGAGISTDSGIPDFRGPQGVWTKNPEAEKASNIHNYVSDRSLRERAWQMKVDAAERPAPQPNDGHRALVDLERSGRLLLLATQNVDGLHLQAGSSRDLVVEVHGTTQEVVCLDCGERAPIERALDRVRAGEPDPACRTCDGILKSATISFGQNLVPEDLMRADQAARECDLFLAVGSTLSVYPIADAVPLAASHGAPIIIVNAEPTAMDDLATVILRGQIGQILPALVADLSNKGE